VGRVPLQGLRDRPLRHSGLTPPALGQQPY
jgi:hypothetical protein